MPESTLPAHPVTEKLLDARGLFCPEPIMLLHREIRSVRMGGAVRVLATDPSTQRDIPKFCSFLGHSLQHAEIIHDSDFDSGPVFSYLVVRSESSDS